MHPALRLMLCLAVFCYGVATIGNGLDRAVVQMPMLAQKVPGWFAVNALAAQSEAAIQAGHTSAAVSLAEQTVTKAPVDPLSTALLGAARLASMDAVGAETAFRVAGQFGWRQRLTQIYWMQAALSLGDYRIAAQRLDALLRQYPELLADRRIMDPFERNPQARAAMVDSLAGKPGWLTPYAYNVENVAPDIMQIRSEVLTEVAARGQRVGCDIIAPSVRQLASIDAIISAARLWRLHCSSAGTGAVINGEFTGSRLTAPLTRFDWTILGDGDLGVTVAAGRRENDHQLRASSTAHIRRSFLDQQLAALPGAYVLRWKADDAQGNPTDRIAAVVGCDLTNKNWLQGQLDSQSGEWSTPVLIDGACQGHWLEFSIAPGSGEILFDDVKLDAVK